MNPSEFHIGFWHPFGPHAGQDAKQILERKQREIETNDGWTLWSFQKRSPFFFQAWCSQLKTAETACVFCSEGKGAKDPPHAPICCTSYRPADKSDWIPIPAPINVPHPFRNGQNEATAFIVQAVIIPLSDPIRPNVTWYKMDASGTSEWRSDRVPTRGEYLIRPGDGLPIRKYRAILVLKKPYIAALRAEIPDTPS